MDKDIINTTLSDMEGKVPDYSVDAETTDGVSDQKETRWPNLNWTKQLGVYKTCSEFKRAIITLAIWVAGKGWTADNETSVILENITGWGEDTFTSVCKNHVRIKKVAGDAFAQIVRNANGTLINLKPLDPSSMVTIVNNKGIVIRYEQISKVKGKKPKKFSPQQILHSVNNRIADEIHGDSDAEAMGWMLEAKQEAMRDYRRICHRATIRIMYIDAEDTTKLTHIKTEYATAIKKGELMIIPAKKGEAEFEDLTIPPIEAFMRWIEYLDNKFYQDIGVPRVLVTSEGFTESGGKVGFLTFEPIYTDEQVELEADLWNQCAIKVKFNRPPSLGGALQRDEAKDTGQMGFQPADTEVKEGRE